MIFFQLLFLHKGGDNTSRAVIVPGTTIGSGGEIPLIPLVIRALVIICLTRLLVYCWTEGVMSTTVTRGGNDSLLC